VHDLARIEGDISLDVAEEGETFQGLGNRTVVTRPNEVVLRDQLGIWASYSQGPDARTVVDAATFDVIVLGFFTPETSRGVMVRGLEDAVELLVTVGGGEAGPVTVIPA
jgi:DNA/RNA-binding domain of Phe-tRNA-synthetase-like protein